MKGQGPDEMRPDGQPVSRRRFLFTGASVLAGTTVLGACGSDSGGGTTSASSTPAATTGGATTTAAAAIGDGKSIGLSMNGFNGYNQAMATGFLQALEGTQYEPVAYQANYAPRDEVSNFDTLISKGVAGIVCIPTTVQSANRAILNAKAANIPVVNMLWVEPTAADDACVARMQIDNIKGGQLLADWITKNTDPGEVVVVTGVPGQGYSDQFSTGLEQGLKGIGQGKWKIVGTQPGLFARTEGIKAAENLTTAHPNAKIIVDYGGDMCFGICSWIKQNNRTDLIHCTGDGEQPMVQLLKDKTLHVMRYYTGAELGFVGTKLLRDFIENGKKPDDIVQASQAIVTLDNVEEWLQKVPAIYPNHLAEAQKLIA